MATREVVNKFIATKYEDLPARLHAVVSFEDWRKEVIDYCVARGLHWESPARNVCNERHYYEHLLAEFRSQKRLFPYHLGEYVCRVLRVTPFAFYCDILVDNMKKDSAYDAIPNFTAADIAGTVGVGRNQYIAIMQQAKSKMLWRVNKGVVRDLLPELPQNIRPPHPWWGVCVVNLGEVEYRTMSLAEAEVCRMAAKHADGVPFGAVDAAAVASLYARGLVWFNVQIDAGDRIAIPPLEGFVSNKTASVSIDPLETLLYQIFVAASESVTVAELADILDTSVDNVKVGISMACRLGFCNKLEGNAMRQADEDDVPKMPSMHITEHGAPAIGSSPTNHTPNENQAGRADARTLRGVSSSTVKDKKSIAFVVDSAVTGFLMMGALTPEVKKHSVTLFEGGRVYGAGVIDELVRGLEASVDMSKNFEGEMLELGRTSRSMASVLRFLQSTAASSTELLRKESIEQVADKEQAERILARSHDVLICATGLKGPALPLKDIGSGSGPTLVGPSTLCLTPWLNISLYKHSGFGPKSVVIPAGSMLETDELFRGATKVLVWRWDDAHVPQTLSPRTALFAINAMLQTAAVMIQPVYRPSQPVQLTAGDEPVFVPLPFLRNSDGSVDAFTADDGDLITIDVDEAVESALKAMGLLRNVGYVSFLSPNVTEGVASSWVPLGVAVGIPLYPVSLCETLCKRLSEMAFLSPEALERQRENQILLETAVLGECDDHSAAWPVREMMLLTK